MRICFKTGIGGLAALALAGCVTSSGPAVLSGTDAASHAELEATVSKALNGADVTLASDVLTESNRLVIERKRHRTISNNPVQGRIMDKPDHFTLSKSGRHCILTHEETDENYPLNSVDCTLIPSD